MKKTQTPNVISDGGLLCLIARLFFFEHFTESSMIISNGAALPTTTQVNMRFPFPPSWKRSIQRA